MDRYFHLPKLIITITTILSRILSSPEILTLTVGDHCQKTHGGPCPNKSDVAPGVEAKQNR